MTHKERMYKALRHQEPDRVPKGDVMIHDLLIEKLLGRDMPGAEDNALLRWMTEDLSDEQFAAHRDVREMLGIDWVHSMPLESSKPMGVSPEGYPLTKDIWGTVIRRTPESFDAVSVPIPDIEAADEYELPKAEDFGYGNLQRWVNESDFFTVFQLDTGFFKVYQLVGFDTYVIGVKTHPRQLHSLMERFVQLELDIARKAVAMGVNAIWLANDFAHNTGTFMRPQDHWEFDFQYAKWLVAEIHKLGVPVIMHACGNMNHTLDMLVEVGIDALHSLQPSAHNDIGEIKRKYGDRLCLIGNIDINYLVTRGSAWEVDQGVKETIQQAAPGGGYVLATTNLLNEDVPPENALAMYWAGEKYGQYPIGG